MIIKKNGWIEVIYFDRSVALRNHTRIRKYETLILACPLYTVESACAWMYPRVKRFVAILQRFRQLYDELVRNENILLASLGFDCSIDHPHTHVVKCCQLIKGEYVHIIQCLDVSLTFFTL